MAENGVMPISGEKSNSPSAGGRPGSDSADVARSDAARRHPILSTHLRQGTRYGAMAGQAQTEDVETFTE